MGDRRQRIDIMRKSQADRRETRLAAAREKKGIAAEEESSSGEEDEPAFDKKKAEEHVSVICNEQQQNVESLRSVLASAQFFRHLLSKEKDPPITPILGLPGLIPKIVELLTKPDPKLKDGKVDDSLFNTPESRILTEKIRYEAAWILTNIASGSSSQTQELVAMGVIPAFLQMLTRRMNVPNGVFNDFNPNINICAQCIWALGNIAGDGPRLRDLVLESDALNMLLVFLTDWDQKWDQETFRNSVWFLSNLCRGKPAPSLDIIEPALSILPMVLESGDKLAMADAAWALSYISDGANERIAAVVGAGDCVQILTNLLTNESPEIVVPALRTLGNLVTGDDLQTEQVLSSGLLDYLPKILEASRQSLVKEALWTYSNITAGTRSQIQQVIDSGCLLRVSQLLKHQGAEIRKEASWVICNMLSGGSKEQIESTQQKVDFLSGLGSVLDSRDARLAQVVLEGLDHYFRTTGDTSWLEQNAEKIEELQHSPNEQVYTRALHILQTYLADEEDGEDAQAPTTAPAPGFGGGFGGPGGPGLSGGFTFSF